MRSDDEAFAFAAVEEFFALLDAEDWEAAIARLDDDAQLADELTGAWLRGKTAVARYLRAQRDVVTDIISEPKDMSGCVLGDGNWMVTFNATQQYLLAGTEHREQLTGCCVVSTTEDDWSLIVFHLGGPGGASQDRVRRRVIAESVTGSPQQRRTDSPTERPPTVRTLGEITKAHRVSQGMSLRSLAERSGLSASFLSQVERSLTDPSVGSIRQIARGLGVSAADMIGESDNAVSGVVLARVEDRIFIDPHHIGLTIEAFPSHGNAGLRAEVRSYQPDLVVLGSDGVHDHDELIFVLDGAIEVSAGGARTVLVQGDGVTVKSGSMHTYRPMFGQCVRLLIVEIVAEVSAVQIAATTAPVEPEALAEP